MHRLLRSTLCLATLLAAPLAAHADGFGYHPASPLGPPPGPVVVQTPVEVVAGPPFEALHEGWQRHAWRDYARAAAFRAQQLEEQLSAERASFVARWGWQPERMAWFDQHQAQERAAFAQDESARRAAFFQELAFRGQGEEEHDRHGWGHRHHHHHHEDEDD